MCSIISPCIFMVIKAYISNSVRTALSCNNLHLVSTEPLTTWWMIPSETNNSPAEISTVTVLKT